MENEVQTPKKYKVLTTCEYQGVGYEEGQIVDLSEEVANAEEVKANFSLYTEEDAAADAAAKKEAEAGAE